MKSVRGFRVSHLLICQTAGSLSMMPWNTWQCQKTSFLVRAMMSLIACSDRMLQRTVSSSQEVA